MIKIGVLALLVLTAAHCLTFHDAEENYSLKTNSIKLSKPITVSMSDDRITFKGCNFNSAGYTRNQKQFTVSQNWVSTLMYCPNDIDPQIVDLFKQVRTYKEGRKGFKLYDSEGKLVITLKQ